MRRLCLMLLCLMMIFPAPVMADGVCLIGGHALENGVTTSCNYVSVMCPADAPGQVLVSIWAPDGSLAWQRDYGQRSEPFATEDIYLRLQGTKAVYQAEVKAGGQTYRFPIVREMARLTGNAACTAGYPLSMIAGGDTWACATILDLNSIRGSSVSVPVYASSAYVFGTATMTVKNDTLTVNVRLANGLDGTVDSAVVRVATDALSAEKLAGRSYSGPSGTLGTAIPLGGADYAAVYVSLTVSFNPGTAQLGIPPQPSDEQRQLWNDMKNSTANEAIG